MAAEISTSDRPDDSWMTLKTLPLHRNQVLVQKRQAQIRRGPRTVRRIRWFASRSSSIDPLHSVRGDTVPPIREKCFGGNRSIQTANGVSSCLEITCQTTPDLLR